MNLIFKRNMELPIRTLLGQFPAIAIIDARQVGKTELAKLVAPDYSYIDLEKGSDYDRISSDVEFFFKQHPDHIIFDEAQLYPPLFATLRGA